MRKGGKGKVRESSFVSYGTSGRFTSEKVVEPTMTRPKVYCQNAAQIFLERIYSSKQNLLASDPPKFSFSSFSSLKLKRSDFLFTVCGVLSWPPASANRWRRSFSFPIFELLLIPHHTTAPHHRPSHRSPQLVRETEHHLSRKLSELHPAGHSKTTFYFSSSSSQNFWLKSPHFFPFRPVSTLAVRSSFSSWKLSEFLHYVKWLICFGWWGSDFEDGDRWWWADRRRSIMWVMTSRVTSRTPRKIRRRWRRRTRVIYSRRRFEMERYVYRWKWIFVIFCLSAGKYFSGDDIIENNIMRKVKFHNGHWNQFVCTL